MISAFFLILLGALVGGGATLFVAARLLQRQQRTQLDVIQSYITRQVGLAVNKAVNPLCVTAGKLTEVVSQMQESQGKQHEQLHKLAEFSLQMKKEMAILSARQLADIDEDGDFAATAGERPRFLN